MKNSANSPISHFVAINCHSFHKVESALDCTRSVLLSARGFSGQVEILFFYHSDQKIPAELEEGLEQLKVRKVYLPKESNGENLNRQLEKAKGFTFFYRVDADDLVSQGRFKWQSELLVNSEYDIYGGGLIYHNIKTGREFQALPSLFPGTCSYLINQYFLHPTLAFRMETFKPRYGAYRLEDKELALSAVKMGLSTMNDQRIYGTYNLNPKAREGREFALRDLELNLSYIMETRKYWAIPATYCLFVMSRLISRNTLRNLRRKLL